MGADVTMDMLKIKCEESDIESESSMLLASSQETAITIERLLEEINKMERTLNSMTFPSIVAEEGIALGRRQRIQVFNPELFVAESLDSQSKLEGDYGVSAIEEQEVTVEEEESVKKLENDVIWLAAELRAMHNHLVTLESKTMSSHFSLHPAAMAAAALNVDMPDTGKKRNNNSIRERKRRSSAATQRIQILQSLKVELQNELDATEEFLNATKSANNELEKILKSDEPEIQSKLFADPSQIWSPLPSPNLEPCQMLKEDNFRSPAVESNSTPRSHRMPPGLSPLDLEEYVDDNSSIATSTIPSPSMSRTPIFRNQASRASPSEPTEPSLTDLAFPARHSWRESGSIQTEEERLMQGIMDGVKPRLRPNRRSFSQKISEGVKRSGHKLGATLSGLLSSANVNEEFGLEFGDDANMFGKTVTFPQGERPGPRRSSIDTATLSRYEASRKLWTEDVSNMTPEMSKRGTLSSFFKDKMFDRSKGVLRKQTKVSHLDSRHVPEAMALRNVDAEDSHSHSSVTPKKGASGVLLPRVAPRGDRDSFRKMAGGSVGRKSLNHLFASQGDSSARSDASSRELRGFRPSAANIYCLPFSSVVKPPRPTAASIFANHAKVLSHPVGAVELSEELVKSIFSVYRCSLVSTTPEKSKILPHQHQPGTPPTPSTPGGKSSLVSGPIESRKPPDGKRSGTFWARKSGSSPLDPDTSGEGFEGARVAEFDPNDPYCALEGHPCGQAGDYPSMLLLSDAPCLETHDTAVLGELHHYRMLMDQLETVDPSGLVKEEKLAFWINLFNATLMHAYALEGAPQSQTKRVEIMNRSTVRVGGLTVSASEIENHILRATSNGSPQLTSGSQAAVRLLRGKKTQPRSPVGTKFDPSDVRSLWALDAPEPSVSFALCSGSYSSPALRLYSASSIREELEKARTMFLLASVGISKSGTILLPKVLEWYWRDFVAEECAIVDWVESQLPEQQQLAMMSAIARLRKTGASRVYKVLPFDGNFRYLVDVKDMGVQAPGVQYSHAVGL